MLVTKPVGRDAAVKKYDILSALSALGLSQDKHAQRRILRLMALITTRYNWQRNELTMAQTEIAKLWCVDLRTVKREMAKLRSTGWLIETRCAARGRVASHAIDLARILTDTRAVWGNIGQDFVERQRIGTDIAVSGNVVPFAPLSGSAPKQDGSIWSEVRAAFHALDPSGYAAWIGPLQEAGCEQAVLALVAPSRFHASYVQTHFGTRLLHLLQRVDPTIRAIRFDF